jgi:hypothetical protein
MRPLVVVVVDIDAQHSFEVAVVEDQQPVEALGAHRSDEALGDSVRLGRLDRCPQDPDPFAAEDLIEGAAVFAVSVAEQEADLLFGEEEAEVAGLLGDQASIGVAGAAGQQDAAAGMLEEQDVVAAQEHSLDREEVTRHDARRLRAQELAAACT